MFAEVVVLSALLLGTIGSPINGRIVNGTDAKPGEIKYIVSLRVADRHNCGGSILDERHIMTAAHCVKGMAFSSLNIQYGVLEIEQTANATNLVKIEDAVYNEAYDPGSGYRNDVAILKLATPLVFGPNVQPIKLPPAYNATPENSPAILSGWGYPYTGGPIMTHLQRVDIMVYSDDACEEAHDHVTNREYNICAGVPEGGKGQCSGDSGGPLVVDGVQVGIVSWSVKPCTVKGYPGVFTKVSTQIPWIQQQLAILN